MRNTLTLITALLIFQACQSGKDSGSKTTDDSSENTKRLGIPDGEVHSDFIPIDTGNKMLSSYLNSIDYSDNDTDLHSLVISASQLKQYLNTAPDSIAYFKLMFAHKLSYVNAGHVNTNVGYSRNAFTIIIAACDTYGNYIYANGNQVLDYSSPCPPGCPPGEAANPLLIE